MRAEYTIMPETPLVASNMTPGTLTMYLLQGVLTSEKRNLIDIMEAHGKLDTAASRGIEAVARNCRTKMQLAFAVNRHVGQCLGDEAPTSTASLYSEDSADMAGRRRLGHMPRPEAAEAEEEGKKRERDSQFTKGNKKRDTKEQVKRAEKKDRKKDHRQDRKWHRK